DIYADNTAFQSVVFQALDLPYGPHTVQIMPADVTKSISVDAFMIYTKQPQHSGKMVNDSELTYAGGWGIWNDTPLYMGDLHYSNNDDYNGWPQASYTFYGTGVQWITTADPWANYGDVYIDGVFDATVTVQSQTSESMFQQVVYQKTGLTEGTHTIMIAPHVLTPSISIDALNILDDPAPADKSALMALISQAKAVDPALYYAGSVYDLNKAIAAARIVADNPLAAQDQVDEQVTLLQNALDALIAASRVKVYTPVSASASSWASYWGNYPQNAMVGGPETGWMTNLTHADPTVNGGNGSEYPMWWQMDLGTPQVITNFEMRFFDIGSGKAPENYPGERRNFVVQGSNNGTAWTTLASQGSDTILDSDYWYGVSGDAVNAYRYIRVSKTVQENGDAFGSYYFAIGLFKALNIGGGEALSSDASLSALSIDQGTLTPGFGAETLAYTADVENSVDSITVTATASDPKATVTGDGAHSLDVGENIITVTVRAEDGTTRDYTITVTRAEAPVVLTDVSVATQPKLAYAELDKLDLSGLSVTLSYSDGTSRSVGYADFAANGITLAYSNGKPAAGSDVLTAAAHNGLALVITCGDFTAMTGPLSVTINAACDVNGDGKVDASDLALIMANLNKKASTNAITKKCDVDGSGMVDIMDYNYVAAYIAAVAAAQ
ncbi:MAG: cadherin-like beta sandwich domain-containing protein, partial [Defluviitaleaceae bacterium]|nr:cadherin-like beta sandwich domain-containing protein [Defluviitaleaceae bacterium]